MVPFGQILTGVTPEHAQVVVEGDNTFEVVGVIHGRAGGVHPDEAVNGGQRHHRLTGQVVGVGLVQLRLQRQRGARCAGFELFVQADGFFNLLVRHLVFGFGVQLGRCHAQRFVDHSSGAGTYSGTEHDQCQRLQQAAAACITPQRR